MKKQFNEADVIGKPEQGSRERERYWRTYLEDFVSSNIGIPKWILGILQDAQYFILCNFIIYIGSVGFIVSKW